MILKLRGQNFLQLAMKSQGFQDHYNPL